MRQTKVCKQCKTPLSGRADKKFCDNYCKSAWYYQKGKNENGDFYKKVDKQLKLNRKILKTYNKAGKATVRKQTLIGEGFAPNFFTHYWKNGKGQVYLFVYEFGFLALEENSKVKYLLIKWQNYMEK